jgi:hypothetical protein
MVSQITEGWISPAYTFADEVHDIVVDFMTEVIAEHFAGYATGGLQQHVTYVCLVTVYNIHGLTRHSVIVNEHIRNCAEEARSRIKWLLSLEDTPFTLNAHYYEDYKEKFHKYFKSVFDANHDEGLGVNFHTFKSADAEEHQRDAMSEILRGLNTFGLSNVSPADLAKLLPPNHRESALKVMAEVRAYYQGSLRFSAFDLSVFTIHAVAYKRFGDNVPLAVDREILRGLDSGIGPALFRGLGLGGENGHQKCKELLQEPPNTASRRTELQKKRDRLSTGKNHLTCRSYKLFADVFVAKRELMTLSMF